MKKSILEALKAKFPDLSESVLNRIADKLAKTVTTEEAVATAVEGVTLQSVVDGYGDSRANEASQNAVVNYEKKHNLKDGKANPGGAPDPKVEPTPTPTPDDGTPAWAKQLLDQNKALNERIALMEGAKTSDIRRQQLEKALEKATPAFKSTVLNAYQYMQFENEEAFTAYLEKTSTDMEEFNKGLTEQQLAGVGKPFVPTGGTNAQASKEETAAIVNQIM